MRIGAVVGLAAHVDAGKTTLSESMLYLAGAVRKQGRVDHRDTFLDTDKMEKERGITIFSKEARLSWNKTELTLVDTPGHTDFSGETERALSIMDLAVLVISAPEGVQPHTRTLWRLMEQYQVPTVLFINKMDRYDGSREDIMERLHRELSEQAVDFTEDPGEKIAMCDETCLDAYLREGTVPDRLLWQCFRRRGVFPCFFGAALKNEGVEPLLDFLAKVEIPKGGDVFGARVYKIARDAQGARLAFMKITGGTLRARDTVAKIGEDGEPEWAEKAAELRMYSGAKYTAAAQAEAGQLVCAVGLSKAMPGDGLGAAGGGQERQMRPCYACRIVFPQGTDLHYALNCLRTLEEEEPLIQTEYIEARREIRVHSMGDVYLEILQRQLKDRFGLDAAFTDSGVLYRETIENEVEGMGHYEPLRHYAEVHLLLTPLPRGSGVQTASAVPTDDLALNWQRLIMTHLTEVVHTGVLTGSPITDLKITLVNGRAHLKHTEGGDFRQATYRALRQGLMKAKCILLEPWVSLEVTVPGENIGRVLSDVSMMGGQPEGPEELADGMKRVRATVPARSCASYGREVSVFTKGRGSAQTAFHAWLPCKNQAEVIAERGYDPERDTLHPADSVFCSHGAGVVVNWREADQYMHLPSWKELRERRQTEARMDREMGGSASAYRGTREEDEALARIFERTYGPGKARSLTRPSRPESSGSTASSGQPASAPNGREILLVDGYNVLFAWEEWKQLVTDGIDAARSQLTELMCNYAGMTGRDVILVFDAYKVKGNPGSAEKYKNIYVVYTKELQTADAYIEKTTLLARRDARVRVVTSDQPEQLIAMGNAAMRTSAREFRQEVIQVQGSIAEFIARHNRPGAEKAIERAYKEAWKKQHQKDS